MSIELSNHEATLPDVTQQQQKKTLHIEPISNGWIVTAHTFYPQGVNEQKTHLDNMEGVIKLLLSSYSEK